jgi:hypothetical protein
VALNPPAHYDANTACAHHEPLVAADADLTIVYTVSGTGTADGTFVSYAPSLADEGGEFSFPHIADELAGRPFEYHRAFTLAPRQNGCSIFLLVRNSDAVACEIEIDGVTVSKDSGQNSRFGPAEASCTAVLGLDRNS